MSLREHSIYDCILNNARNFSDEIALVSGDLRLTYGEVPFHVNSLARGLLNTGFEKGDRIAVLLNNCAEYALLLIVLMMPQYCLLHLTNCLMKILHRLQSLSQLWMMDG